MAQMDVLALYPKPWGSRPDASRPSCLSFACDAEKPALLYLPRAISFLMSSNTCLPCPFESKPSLLSDLSCCLMIQVIHKPWHSTFTGTCNLTHTHTRLHFCNLYLLPCICFHFSPTSAPWVFLESNHKFNAYSLSPLRVAVPKHNVDLVPPRTVQVYTRLEGAYVVVSGGSFGGAEFIIYIYM